MFFYVFMFICLITGHFWDYVYFVLIICFHELGHVLGGLIFSWKIEKVILLPIGGITIFNNLINTSLFEQFVVTLLGPLFQIVFYFILDYFFCFSSLVCFFNFFVLFFNLLPIFPLDGSKFLYIFLCLLFPFKFCHLLCLIVSLLFLLFVLFFYCDIVMILVFIFLLISFIKEFINHKNIFYKFLLERYMYNFNFKNLKVVNDVSKMRLNRRHVFFYCNKYITEREYLLKMFDK